MAKERFYEATDKLINAFIKGKIKHTSCCSCAVGTLCDNKGDWSFTETMCTENGVYNKEVKLKSIIFIKTNTKYSVKEIFEIERNFEGRAKPLIGRIGRELEIKESCNPYLRTLNKETDPDGFKGLCNVFDYLISLEDWSEDENKVNLIEMCEQD